MLHICNLCGIYDPYIVGIYGSNAYMTYMAEVHIWHMCYAYMARVLRIYGISRDKYPICYIYVTYM